MPPARDEPPPSKAFAAVAVPVPFPGPLTYDIPEGFRSVVQLGLRVKVRVGKRRLVGVIVNLPASAPEGIRTRPIDELVDRESLIPPDLLKLAWFCSDYYFSPLGDVMRSLLPLDLPGWGQKVVSLTDAGAFAAIRDPEEAAVVAKLRDSGRLSLSELQKCLGGEGVAATVERLSRSGRLREHGSPKGARYVTAYELAPGELEEQKAACGKSAKGRAVIEYLDALRRPATSAEICSAMECTAAVLRRLAGLGLLRKFTQVERLALDRHVMSTEEAKTIILRPDQAGAVGPVVEAIQRQEFAPFLLQGMTGSGKTEVYLRAVEGALEMGRGAILLVPEIALVPALARAVRGRFGDLVALLHSNLGASERRQEWERIQTGEARVVLGPRSAIFAPIESVGLIVVDEEQDSAYKQESNPRYNGRDLALVRGRSAGAAVVLVSATPSLESRHNAETGRYSPLALTTRAGQGKLPEGILVDLKEEEGARRPGDILFSTRLRMEIEATLADGAQVILLRNRRGYSPVLLCRACGEDMRCEDCGLPRTYHRREERLICHYCGDAVVVPKVCAACGEEALEAIGTGTERLEEQFRELYPFATAAVLDRDAVRQPGGAAAVLERFGSGQVQVLIGTQMVSKGHHFPGVALTGVLSADTYLGFPDFRAVERTYNLLVQLAGRAGRGEKPGRVVIQTYHPDHYAIRAALSHDDQAFAAEEMRFRRIFHYPPFTRMVQILVKDSDRLRGRRKLDDLAEAFHRHPLAHGVRITGPAPAPLERLRGKWRFQLLLRAANGSQLRRLVAQVVPEQHGGDLVVDVDPQDLL